MTADDFAYSEYLDYITYQELAKVESVPEFRKILEQLIQHELDDYRFWLQFSSKKKFTVSPIRIFFLKIMRRLLGLTFTAKFIEGNEKKAIRNYTEFLATAEEPTRARIQAIIEHERWHEREMINQVKEERVEFIGSIILGLNDGLIELTGALVGFSFALLNTRLAALAGLITGIAASLSMASSAFLQARHEKGKEPRKAALYTGFSYITVVLLMVLPFLTIQNLWGALGTMSAIAFLVIGFTSYYTSVLFERDFKRQLGEMILFSFGVAFITFLIGSAFRAFSGVQI
ncbi:MAG: VIT1/CCC1 transporter family protein [Candidatus Omnitrophica bacterium]|nr:VIT1/CCC1 transporter family protein [Candidatus Omnitrophota bacterium]